jgi:hypothetical protein
MHIFAIQTLLAPLQWAERLNLAAARLRHIAGRIAGTAWSTKKYFNTGLLKDQQLKGALTA